MQKCQDIKTESYDIYRKNKTVTRRTANTAKGISTTLDIDTATYCKIEKGERRARKEHISIIAEILQADYEELLKLWLADQVTAVVADEKELSNEVLKISKKNINSK